MANVLILFSTVDGQTLKICKRIQQVIEAHGDQVRLEALGSQQEAELRAFDKIIIGASIRYGKHRPQVYDFIVKNRKILEAKPSAFFSVNIVARKQGKNHPDTNPYVIKFRQQTTWRPDELAVFAGKIDYPKYGFWDRNIIRLIMLITKGPTEHDAVVEYTNWNEVEAFGKRMVKM